MKSMASSLLRKKRNHSVKTYEEKLEIITFAEENPHLKQKVIAEKYGMKPQTLSDLLKNRDSIKARFTRHVNPQRVPVIKPSPSNIDIIHVVDPGSPEHVKKKRKLRTKSFKEKLEIIKFAEENPSLKQKAIAAIYDMKPQTLSDLLKNKEMIKARAAESEHLQRGTRQRKITHEDVDKALILWYRDIACTSGMNVDGESLRRKACYFARQFARESSNNECTNISHSWIERFKKRYGIGRAAQAGGIQKLISGTCNTWSTVVLPSILHSFPPQDIYNFDETALLWSLLPHDLDNEDFSLIEDRVTILVGANVNASDKPPVLVIGKSKTPEPFRNAKWLPVNYVYNRNACLTKSIFMDYIKTLDDQFQLENRHVAIILKSSSAHPLDSIHGLSNITVFYMPSDVKVYMQPLKAAVFRDLKFRYRYRLCKRRLASLEEDLPFSYDLLDAVISLCSSWNDVKSDVIRSGFVIAGISSCSNNPHTERLECSQDFSVFKAICTRMADLCGSKDIMPLKEFIEIDKDIQTVENMAEEDVLEIVDSDCDSSPMHEDMDSISENEVEVIVLETEADMEPKSPTTFFPSPSTSEALAAVDTLRRFWLSRRNINDLGFDLQEIEDAILSESIYSHNDYSHV